MVSPHPFARSGRNPQRTSPGERLGFSSGTPPLAGPAAWTKSPEPVSQRTDQTFGVGHNSFVTSPDGREDGLVDHAKIAVAPGWQRTLRRQPFTWRADGTPNFGPPVAAGLALPAPSGQPDRTRPNTSFAEDVRSGLGAWDGFAHPHYVRSAPGELRLGHPERDLVNAFRSGEKIVLRDRTWSARGPHVDRTWSDARFAVRRRVTPGGPPAGPLKRRDAFASGEKPRSPAVLGLDILTAAGCRRTAARAAARSGTGSRNPHNLS